MKRGEIYYIKSNYSETGFEMKGDRPAVIVSNDKNNERSGVLEVVFLTTKPKRPLPTHVLVREDTARPSTVLCEQITSVDIGRFSDYMGTLTDEEMRAVDKALAVSIGLPVPGEDDELLVGLPVTQEEADDAEEECPGCEELLQMKAEMDACRRVLADYDLVKAERNVYQQLYRELLEKVTR